VENQYFEYLILLSVVLNTFVLAMDGTLVQEEQVKALDTMNYTFTMVFSVEMGLKILGYGLTGYI